jgi:hypothetical protein
MQFVLVGTGRAEVVDHERENDITGATLHKPVAQGT